MEIFTVAFFGHRYIDNPFRIEERLEEHIYRLLAEKEYVDFLVGRDGEFDQFASSAVLRVRKRYRDDNSSLILGCRMQEPNISTTKNPIITTTARWRSPTKPPKHTRKQLSKSVTVKWLIVPTLSSAALSARKAVPGRRYNTPLSKAKR